MKNIKKILCAVLVAVLIVSTSVCLFACNSQSNVGNNDLTYEVTENGVSLLATSGTTTIGGVEYPSVTLNATVLPADAEDKSVTWTAEWAVDSALSAQAVSDYVTLTSDGLKATIVCKKSFRGNVIVVKVKTNVGGFSATCNVKFEGHPSGIDVSGTTGQRSIVFEGSGSWTVTLTNVFDDVGSDYAVTVKSLSWEGTYDACDVTLDSSGTRYDNAHTGYFSDVDISEYVKATCTNGTLTVTNTKSIIGAYVERKSGSQYTKYLSYCTGLGDLGSCLIYIVLQCGDLEKTVSVNLISSVTAVSLDAAEYTF